MSTKTVNARIQLKTDTSTNWAKATSFVPKSGEFIFYSDTKKAKVGDGSATVVNLPFMNAADADTLDGQHGSYYATAASVNAKYTKPNTGIPKTDLASSVQTSLSKADNALPKTGGTMTGSLLVNDNTTIGAAEFLHSPSGMYFIDHMGYLFDDASEGTVSFAQIISTCSGGCIIEGTKITMADGSLKNIEDIRNGDEVLGIDITTMQQVPTIVIAVPENHSVREYSENIFEDGTVLNTVEEHFLYNAIEGRYAVSDIQDREKDVTTHAALKQDGSIVHYQGRFTHSTDYIRNFHLLTSNNTYYAGGLLNTCFPPSKFYHLKRVNRHMPAELYEAVKSELDFNRRGNHKTDNPDFLREVKEVKGRYTAISQEILAKKQALSDSDYQVAKAAEATIQSLLTVETVADIRNAVAKIYTPDMQAKIAQRIADRQFIKDNENLEASLDAEITALKEKYGIISDFEKLSNKEQFKICNKLGNDNIELYRAWLQRQPTTEQV